MYNYCLNGQIICRESSTKNLGVTITSTLRWNEHCDNICKKANSTLGPLKRILGSCSPAVKARAYLSLVRPKLEYASWVWNPHTKRNSEKIEMIQHHAARFVNNDFSRYSHVSPMINSLEWDTLERRRLLNHSCMLYKIHQGCVDLNSPLEVHPGL